MSFSYLPTVPATDLVRVRWHTGQTVEAESFISDEEIALVLAEETAWQAAVIGTLKFIIARLSQPGFRADWLQVEYATARAGFETLLAMKRAEFGLPATAPIVATAVHVRRADTTPVPDSFDTSPYDGLP